MKNWFANIRAETLAWLVVGVILVAALYSFFSAKRPVALPQKATAPATRPMPAPRPQPRSIHIPDKTPPPTKKVATGGSRKKGDAVNALRDALAAHADQATVDAALQDVVQQGASAVGALQRLLADSHDKAAIQAYAYALAKIGAKPALEALFSVISSRSDKEEKYLMQRMLAEGASDSSVATMIELVAGSPNEEFRKISSHGLTSVSAPYAVDALAEKAKALKGEDRARLVDIIGNMNSPAVESALQKQVAAADRTIAKAAARALANHESESAMELLLNSLGLPSSPSGREQLDVVIEEASRVLRNNPHKPALAIVPETLMTTSANERTRVAAIAALYNGGSASGDRKLLQSLQKAYPQETSAWVKEIMNTTIQQLQGSANVPTPKTPPKK